MGKKKWHSPSKAETGFKLKSFDYHVRCFSAIDTSSLYLLVNSQ